MSLICYRDKGSLSDSEQNDLDVLFNEKNKITSLLNGSKPMSKKDCRLYTYGVKNRYKINYNFDITSIKDKKNEYLWVLLRDKNQKLLGYICFEYVVLDFVENQKKLLLIHDLFISNHVSECNKLKIDELLYSLMIVSNCNLEDMNKLYIVSKHNYRFCNGFNGFGKVINTSIYSYYSNGESDDLYIKTPTSKVFKF